ncbi:MAG: DUF2330 domain-containing protein [Mariniblastus sp.]
MKKRDLFTIFFSVVAGLVILAQVKADPCGMVPPIFIGDQSPITRIGLQKTYVFHKDGVETFVIRPGFSGKVDNFGMLIPFPNPPELRKVADDTFDQIANAIDPPEVVVDLRVRKMMMARGGAAVPEAAEMEDSPLMMQKNSVQVLKEEAVGMYEVAVLSAGSAEALKKWMDKNSYKYPDGMDAVTADYISEGWCFVAVKTKVGDRGAVNPQPGQRRVKPGLPDGSVFDGNVQGMGFRFKSDELVVPMRLSAFNKGELRNVVYLLTDGPRKIRAIPEEYVVRQVSGIDLFNNVTRPLPLRIIGGTEKNIPEYRRNQLVKERNPDPKNGIAKELFASDLLAVADGTLALGHEEQEKELLNIGEYFGLRGPDIDRKNATALKDDREKTVASGLELLKSMTLTVVDGDFPREVLAKENLTFANYRMPRNRNNTLNYDANRFGPGSKKEGTLKTGSIDWNEVDYQQVNTRNKGESVEGGLSTVSYTTGILLFGFLGMLFLRRSRATMVLVALTLGVFAIPAFGSELTSLDSQDEMIAKLETSKTAKSAIESIVANAKESDSNRETMIKKLLAVVSIDENIPKRGWAIAALAEIGGQDVDEYLLNVHANNAQNTVVRTWAAAARVSMTRTTNGLIEKANLIRQFPSLGRPIGMRIVEEMKGNSEEVTASQVLEIALKVPQIAAALAPVITAYTPQQLTEVMVDGNVPQVRRMAAGYLGAIAGQGKREEVATSVVESLAFDAMAKDVPWKGGALFLPAISWQKPEATKLVGELVRWMLWCDVNNKQEEKNQLHNNLRSLALARVAGYKSPGWQNVDTNAWLLAWGSVVGRKGIEEILKEQDLIASGKYGAVLNSLK